MKKLIFLSVLLFTFTAFAQEAPKTQEAPETEVMALSKEILYLVRDAKIHGISSDPSDKQKDKTAEFILFMSSAVKYIEDGNTFKADVTYTGSSLYIQIYEGDKYIEKLYSDLLSNDPLKEINLHTILKVTATLEEKHDGDKELRKLLNLLKGHLTDRYTFGLESVIEFAEISNESLAQYFSEITYCIIEGTPLSERIINKEIEEIGFLDMAFKKDKKENVIYYNSGDQGNLENFIELVKANAGKNNKHPALETLNLLLEKVKKSKEGSSF